MQLCEPFFTSLEYGWIFGLDIFVMHFAPSGIVVFSALANFIDPPHLGHIDWIELRALVLNCLAGH